MARTHEVCMCHQCRVTIREAILAAFAAQRRWMGYYTILVVTGLGWVPAKFYRSVFREMLDAGLLLKSAGPADDFPRYLSIRLCRPRKGGGA